MELNVAKVQKEMNRLGWSLEDLRKKCKMKSRQAVHHHIRNKTLKGAVIFGKAFGMDPKDLIKS